MEESASCQYHRSEEGRPLTPTLSPSDGERGKTCWQQGRARPLTPALSPSDGEREKRDCAAAGGNDKMHPMEDGSSRNCFVIRIVPA